MEVSLTPQEESLLAELSARTGRPAEQILREAVDALLEHERWFAEAVEQGRQAAARGELLDHDDEVRRVEERYRS
jgi:predicted transcriptional regulator